MPKKRTKNVTSIGERLAAVHAMESETAILGPPGRTWCGRVSVPGMAVAEKGTQITCQRCLAAIEQARDRDSQQQVLRRNAIEQLAERAYEVWRHRAGRDPVPFAHLPIREQEAWRETVAYLGDEFEDRADEERERAERRK